MDETLDIGYKKTLPQWAMPLVIVALFLGYMIKKDAADLELAQRGDKVAEQRIEKCHYVQKQGIEVMKELRQTLMDHREAYSNMNNALIRLEALLTEYNRNVDSYHRQMAEVHLLLQSHFKEKEDRHDH